MSHAHRLTDLLFLVALVLPAFLPATATTRILWGVILAGFGLKIIAAHRLPFTDRNFHGTWIVTIGAFLLCLGIAAALYGYLAR